MTELKFPYSGLAVNRFDDFPGKPYIVFLHDSLGCIELWRNFPQRLGKLTECNVMIYDRQGYGKSIPFTGGRRDNSYLEKEADILHGLLEYCGILNPILFGHSDGGSIALIAASKYPAKIGGVITEGAHVFVEDITIRGIKETRESYRHSGLDKRLKKYHGDKTDEMFEAWTETWTGSEFLSWDITHFLPGIVCPLLAIQGKNDEYGTEEQVRTILDHIKGSTAGIIIPGAGHTPHKESPVEVLEPSVAFIQRLKDVGWI
jgi:pimeloyl-ACP methyl ester carboxylesterase